MKFCPKCEARMKVKQDEKKNYCPRCGFVSDQTDDINNTPLKSEIQKPDSSLKIMEPETAAETLPTINIECPKCKNNNAYWWMLQTRSADEATTQFYRCSKCNYTWRNYS